MRTLIFFALIFGIDLFLKSVKDKKNIHESREKKIQELRRNQADVESKATETKENREVKRNPSIFRNEKENRFSGEGKSYRDDHEGYRDRYKDRYESIQDEYKDIKESYKDRKTHSSSDALYDKHAIERSERKEYKDLDVRNYGREAKEKVDIPLPKASTLKKDVLNGIIFSEILGKPKSLRK